MKARVQSMSEREQPPFRFIPRPGLFNDVIWACLGAPLCRTCPCHRPNHLPLWFFFSRNFSTGWGIPESLGWEERSFLKCSIGRRCSCSSRDTAKAPSLEETSYTVRSQCQSGQSPSRLWFFALSPWWQRDVVGQRGIWWRSQLWHGRE